MLLISVGASALTVVRATPTACKGYERHAYVSRARGRLACSRQSGPFWARVSDGASMAFGRRHPTPTSTRSARVRRAFHRSRPAQKTCRSRGRARQTPQRDTAAPLARGARRDAPATGTGARLSRPGGSARTVFARFSQRARRRVAHMPRARGARPFGDARAGASSV